MTLSPPLRVLVAVVLAALAVASSASAAEGVTLSRVHGLGPIPFAPATPGLAQPTVFEAELLAALTAGAPGPDPALAIAGENDASHAWREIDVIGGLVDIDLAATYGKLAPAVAYVWLELEAEAPTKLQAWCGSDDGLRLWTNGALKIDAAVQRGIDPRAHRLDLELEAGTNHVLAKITQEGGGWGFAFEIDVPLDETSKHKMQPAINEAIDRGVEYLLSIQEPDGSWRYHQSPYVNGQTALCLFTLLKCGLKSNHEAVVRARTWLTQNPPYRTYSAGVQLMAFCELRDPALDDQIQEITDLLLDWQRSTGWAYPDSHVDLSNHQFAVLGLGAAADHGVKIKPKVWVNAVEQALAWQKDGGGFAYKADAQPSGSMTAGGLTTIGVAKRALGQKNKLNFKHERLWNEASAEALAWFAEHWNPAVNRVPAQGEGGQNPRWHGYYLYGVERVGAFFDVSHFGEHEWYWEGAQTLIGKQDDKGFWNLGDNKQPDTCFALLFLKRATAALSGGSRAQNRGFGERDRLAEVQLRGTGKGPLTLWLDAFPKSVLQEHGWPAEKGGGLRVEKVEYLLDGQVRATVEGDPEKPSRGERYATQITVDDPGEHKVSCIVWLAIDEADDAYDLRSKEFDVRIAMRSEPWMREYSLDRSKNLLALSRFEVRASSQLDDRGRSIRSATDNLLGSSWSSKAGDLSPWITFDFKKPMKANQIVFSHARPDAENPHGTTLAKRVRLTFNGKKKSAREYDLELDARKKTVIPFGKLELIRNLRIEVLSVEAGQRAKDRVGFAEIEFRREK